MIFEKPPVTEKLVTPDDVSISVQSWPGADADRPDIIFVHGYSQSHLCWMAQVNAEPLQRFNLVTYDLRGHGDSEKPLRAEYYRDSQRWANELDSVIAAQCRRPPVVVVWSYAGRIALDYVASHGTEKLAGLVMVSATSNARPESFGPGAAGLSAMHEERLDRNVASVIELWESCTKGILNDEMRMVMIASNMLTPPAVRRHMSGRAADYEAACRSITCPTLIIHGDSDPINTLEMARYSQATIPGSRLSVYEKTGHAPFLERPNRFSRDLAEFVDECCKGR